MKRMNSYHSNLKKIHFDKLKHVSSYYVDLFRHFENCIVSLVGLAYIVMYLKINIFTH